MQTHWGNPNKSCTSTFYFTIWQYCWETTSMLGRFELFSKWEDCDAMMILNSPDWDLLYFWDSPWCSPPPRAGGWRSSAGWYSSVKPSQPWELLDSLRTIQTSRMFWLWLRAGLGRCGDTPPRWDSTCHQLPAIIFIRVRGQGGSSHQTFNHWWLRSKWWCRLAGVSLHNLYPECKHRTQQTHLFSNVIIC